MKGKFIYLFFILLALPWRIQEKNTEDMQTLAYSNKDITIH